VRARLAAALLLALLTACSGPAQQEDGTTLAVIGDFGTGGRSERAVAEAIRDWDRDQGLDALVTTGDNVYPDGSPSKFDQAWRKPYGWTADEDVEVVASLGNHDLDSGDPAELMALLDMPDRYYVKTVGLVQAVVLDANDVDAPGQTAFLARALEEPLPAGARYRVAVFHQAAYSCSDHSSDADVQREWLPLLTDGAVDLVLNGHDHVYQRFTPADGPTFVVTGGGGAKVHDREACPDGTPEPDVAESALHFVVLDATQEGLRIRAITPAGEELDDTTVRPRPSAATS
jgi:predicted phosphodiesterase